jgi:fructokinase
MCARWNVKVATELPSTHRGWDLEAEYLGYAMANCVGMVSPQKIILGGGVLQHQELYGKIRKQTQKLLNGYIQHRLILQDIEEYIVAPGLGNNAGVCGALALAAAASNH